VAKVVSGLAAIDWPAGQGWAQLAELGLALVLSALLGLERELRNKSAGLRTHTLVGVGAALFMLVSKYGFADVLDPGRVTLDPSRVAAQVASGIGFIGGGLIFVRRDAVRGLTTAAVVWVTAAVGLACGAGLPVLAIAVTAGHFIVLYGFTPLSRRFPGTDTARSTVRLTYLDGRGVLRTVLEACAAHGFTVVELGIERPPPDELLDRGRDDRHGRTDAEPTRPDRTVTVFMRVEGKGSVAELTAVIAEIPGVVAVSSGDPDLASD
jgi:putative Mg2+ transporter-C (MgtC) family protein